VSNKGDNTETVENSSARARAPRGVRFDAARPTIGANALARVRPDMRIVVAGDFEDLALRLEGTLTIKRRIAKIAAQKG
jgi:hypothetical protein